MRAQEFITERYDQPYDDPELRNTQNMARMHYPAMKDRTDAMLKFLQRSVKHAKDTDAHQEKDLKLIKSIDSKQEKELELIRKEIEAFKRSKPGLPK